jgi:hypothetical protein
MLIPGMVNPVLFTYFQGVCRKGSGGAMRTMHSTFLPSIVIHTVQTKGAKSGIPGRASCLFAELAVQLMHAFKLEQ